MTIAELVERHRDLWADGSRRYALVRVEPGDPARRIIVDLEGNAFIVVEEPAEVLAALHERMRQAGVPTLLRSELPPHDAAAAHLARERRFYDLLGEEHAEERCRHPDCPRGRVRHSVFCRVHHYESVSASPCPFDD